MLFHRDNHYVPCLYLKRFAGDDGRVATYPILVADSRAPDWKWKSAKGVAHRAHLYTRMVSGEESDEVETWLKREFEDPAEDALGKATADMKLTPKDWRNLIRFVAAQDVRTPARLTEHLQRGRDSIRNILQESLEEAVRKFESATRSGQPAVTKKASYSEYLPLRVTRKIEQGQPFGQVKAEAINGRGFWLFGIRHLLTHSLTVLYDHKWTILEPPNGLVWFTSDDPVVRLNYYGDNRYDFDGGRGKMGTEIILPLDSRHLLYAKVGHRPPPRGSAVPHVVAAKLRRCIAEHAHRFIFAAAVEVDIPKLRPRTVDAGLLRREREQWLKWHEDQTEAERELMGWGAAGS